MVDISTLNISSMATKQPPGGLLSNGKGLQQGAKRLWLLARLQEKKFNHDDETLRLTFSSEEPRTTFRISLPITVHNQHQASGRCPDFLNDVCLGQPLLVEAIWDGGENLSLLRIKKEREGILPVIGINWINRGGDLLAALTPEKPKQTIPVFDADYSEQVNIYEALGILRERSTERPWFFPYGPLLVVRFLPGANEQDSANNQSSERLSNTITAFGLSGLTGVVYRETKNSQQVWVGAWLLTEQQNIPLLTPGDIAFHRLPEPIEKAVIQRKITMIKPVRPEAGHNGKQEEPDVT